MLDLQTDLYLGPAQVEKIENGKYLLQLGDRQAWATNALAMPYQFAEGDVALAIGKHDDWYIVGLIQGSGKTCFVTKGDMSFISSQGSIDFVASKSVRIRTPWLRITAQKFESVAGQVKQRFERVRTQVSSTWELFSQRIRTQAKGTHLIEAQNLKQKAKERVKIDGQKIDLG